MDRRPRAPLVRGHDGIAEDLRRLATGRELHGDRQLEPAVDLVLPDDAIEVRAYPPLHVARLTAISAAVRTVPPSSPARATQQRPHGARIDRAYHDVLEPPAASSALNSSSSANRKNGGPTGMSAAGRLPPPPPHRGARRRPGPLGDVPDRQREPTARDQNPNELGDHLLRPTDCSIRKLATTASKEPPETAAPPHRRDGTRAPDGVDVRARASPRRCRRRRPPHLVRLPPQPRDPVPRPRRGRGRRRRPRSRRATARRAGRDGNEERVVPGDLRLPARCLERVERVRVDRGIGHGRIVRPWAG